MQTIVRNLGIQNYQDVWQNMLTFTQTRDDKTADEIWLVEHPAVYTFGVNGKSKHLLKETNIPVIKSDRGGQITYHASGQLIIYTLFDIQRLQLNIRQIVTLLEDAMISSLAQYGIISTAKSDAPGVYVNDKKIGSVGLRVTKGGCYHGLSLNNNMDLTPFDNINTCGYEGLEVTQLHDLGVHINTLELSIPVLDFLLTSIKK